MLAKPPSGPPSGALRQEANQVSPDDQLECYLGLLHKYSSGLRQISQSFSSGFISLAHANFNSPSHVRFGRDLYDERMQATLRVEITKSPRGLIFLPKNLSNGFVATSELYRPEDSPLEHFNSASEGDQTGPKTTLSTDPRLGGAPEAPSSDSTRGGGSDYARFVGSSAPLGLKDPIRQFGVMTPPSLRIAQASFREGVELGILAIVGAMTEIMAIEKQIIAARMDSK